MGKGGAQPWNKSQWLNLIVEVFKWPQALRQLVLLATVASDWVIETPNSWQKGSSISLFLLHQNSKEKHQSGIRTLLPRECDPPKMHGCIIPRTLTVMLKCGSFQVLESVLSVIKVLFIALHVFHGWMVRQTIMLQLSSHWVPIHICRFCSEEQHPSIKYQSIKCLKLDTMSLLKNKRSLVVWQKWSGSI